VIGGSFGMVSSGLLFALALLGLVKS